MEATAPVTVEQAAAVLGVSVSTVHRRIRSGALRAEQAERPQGKVWLVHLPPDVVAATGQPSSPTASEATAPAAPLTSTPAADAMVSLIQTTIGTVLGPLVAELAATRQTAERQAGRVAELERENGSLTADLANARATVATLEAQHAMLLAPTSAQPSDPSTEPSPLWRRSWVVYGAIVLAVIVVVAGYLLLVPR